MKVCVVGNSHAAALKQAFDTVSAQENSRIEFYAITGGNEPQLAFCDGRFVPQAAHQGIHTTLPDSSGLSLAGFDAVVVSACGLQPPRNHFVGDDPRCHPLGFLSCADWIGDRVGPPPHTHLVSAAVFSATVGAYVRRHPSVAFARALVEHFDGLVLLQPWPAPSHTVKGDVHWFVNFRFGRRGSHAWHDFFLAQLKALQEAVEEFGPRFSVLDYPLPGTTGDGFMAQEWCVEDPWHGNEKYGRLVAEQIREALQIHL